MEEPPPIARGGRTFITMVDGDSCDGDRIDIDIDAACAAMQVDIATDCVVFDIDDAACLAHDAVPRERDMPPKTLHQYPENWVIPEPLAGGDVEEVVSTCGLPTVEALAAWLLCRGCDTRDWGYGDTKEVGHLWKELKGGEAGVELWRTRHGDLQPVRVTHVLRAKVCSRRSFDRGIFLFNTWQQFGDGRKRTRNGLLTEKLILSEMPLESHLHEVCVRAVCEEEMQRIAEASFVLGPGTSAPEYDPGYECPLSVLCTNFCDHTIEIETSKSYPGLLTIYHLYTVDIVCEGLPSIDFNSLEYDHADGDSGIRKLKYVHAWVWLEWSQIQRYLFEGSKLVERKQKGSCGDVGSLRVWLSQFNLALQRWGTTPFKSVDSLFHELESERTQIELWGRHDGVPLLMRVVHIVQLIVKSTDPSLAGKLLLMAWRQSKTGHVRSINRLLARKISIASLPLNEDSFAREATCAVMQQLEYLQEANYQLPLDREKMPTKEDISVTMPKVHNVRFLSHRYEIEESPSYFGLHTFYHKYSLEVEVEGLPATDFTSIDFRSFGGPFVIGYRWVTWPEAMEIAHQRTQLLEKQVAKKKTVAEEMEESISAMSGLMLTSKYDAAADPLPLLSKFDVALRQLKVLAMICGQAVDDASVAHMLPPSMVSKMAQDEGTAGFARTHSGSCSISVTGSAGMGNFETARRGAGRSASRLCPVSEQSPAPADRTDSQGKSGESGAKLMNHSSEKMENEKAGASTEWIDLQPIADHIAGTDPPPPARQLRATARGLSGFTLHTVAAALCVMQVIIGVFLLTADEVASSSAGLKTGIVAMVLSVFVVGVVLVLAGRADNRPLSV